MKSLQTISLDTTTYGGPRPTTNTCPQTEVKYYSTSLGVKFTPLTVDGFLHRKFPL